MCNMQIITTVQWKRNRTWGWNPTATVQAILRGNVIANEPLVRCDTTVGTASGCGYDKESAAVCSAFNCNPLLETLLLWKEFNPTSPRDYDNRCGVSRYLEKHDHGYSWRFGGAGVDAFTGILFNNGFATEMTRLPNEDTVYSSTAVLPDSFLQLV